MKKTISYFVVGVSVLGLLALGSCSKSNSSLPPINGFNSSNDIQKTNLVAYWSFEGNFNETVQSLTPSPSSTAPTFGTGIKGQSYQGSGNTFVSYPIGNLATIPSITVSIWYKQTAVPIPNGTGSYIAGHGAQGMLHMYNSAGTFYVLEIENDQFVPKTSSDSLQFNCGFQSNNTGAYGPNEGVVPVAYFTNSLGKWTHLVMTYDGTTSTYTLYQNGNVVGVNSAWSNPNTPAPVTILNGPTDTGAPMGSLVLNNPLGLIIGSFPQNLNIPADNLAPADYAGNFQGGLDEIRIYKVALSAIEVGSLYQLESTGR